MPEPGAIVLPNEAANTSCEWASVGPDTLRSICNVGDDAPTGVETGVRKEDDFVMDKIVDGCGMLIAGIAVLPATVGRLALAWDEIAPPKNVEDAADDCELPDPDMER